MDNWKELFENKVFITDLGSSQSAEIDGAPVEVGQYAVFSPNKNQEGHQIIEVGNDLTGLCKKYGVPDDRICVVNQAED